MTTTESTEDFLTRLADERKAAVANGDDCYECGQMVSIWQGGTGHRRLCHQCESIAVDRDEVTHDGKIRCPVCGHVWVVYEQEDGDLYDEGSHGVCCDSCGADYEIRTMVTYLFTSPARTT